MKILLASSAFKPAWETGGTCRAVYEVSTHLTQIGHQVTVFTTDRGLKGLKVPKNKPVEVDGVEVYYFRNVSQYLAKKKITTPYYLPLVARKRVKDFDIIHINEHRTPIAAILHHYALQYNVPYVLQAHGSLPRIMERQHLKRVFDVCWGNRLLRDAANLLALTTYEADQYRNMGVDDNKITVVPNGIDLAEFGNLPERGRFRKKYGINDNEKVILYLGRINQIKGLDLLVEAFAGLPKDINGRLAIVGPDDGYLSILRKRIGELKVERMVILCGPLYGEEKLEAYVDADVYVLPSIYETFPVTILEAWACGVPVIVTDQCGIADVVDDNAGIVIPCDPSSLKGAFQHMLSDEWRRQKYSENGKSLVRDKFNWTRIAKQVESMYDIVV